MSGRNFSLTQHLSGFVDRAVRTGRHQNASEVVREALRRYEDDLSAEEASLALIQALAEQGADAIDRGEFSVVQGEEGSRALAERLNRKAAARAASRVSDGEDPPSLG